MSRPPRTRDRTANTAEAGVLLLLHLSFTAHKRSLLLFGMLSLPAPAAPPLFLSS